jgi:flagellar biosynthesis/type III secretory pathway chaperone
MRFFQEYAKWIESTLPANDRAELLSLPRNIMLSRDLAQSANVVTKLRLLHTANALAQTGAQNRQQSRTAAIYNRQIWTDSLNPLLTLWKRLNQQNPGLLQTAQEQSQRPISASQPAAKRGTYNPDPQKSRVPNYFR